MELYREACVHGLPVSLSLSHHNGRESFSFTSIPGPDLAGRPERRSRPRGGREGEDAETMERVQTSQLMPCPLTPLLPGRNRRRLCRKPLSALGGICQASTSN